MQAVNRALANCPVKVFMGCDYPFYKFEMEIINNCWLPRIRETAGNREYHGWKLYPHF
jgi:hypothetical protein